MYTVLTYIGTTIILVLVASYFLYPLLIAQLPTVMRASKIKFPGDTQVYVIIPCYNEEDSIRKKIHNTFQLESPFKLKAYVVIDKSDDRTSEYALSLLDEYDDLYILNKGYRGGKNDSINQIIKKIQPNKCDILVFTDANTFFDKNGFTALLSELEKGTVLVGGSMVYLNQYTNTAKSEGLYWKYEEWIRTNESKLGRLIGMNGGIMAMVAKYFEPLPDYVPNDFETPLRLVSQFQITYANLAKGYEMAIQESREEFCRKERMANRQMNAIIHVWPEMSFITKGQVLCHKVFRWFGLHLFLIQTALFCGCMLFPKTSSAVETISYVNLFILFCLVLVILLNQYAIKSKIIATLAYAISVHYYGGKGAFMALIGRKVSIWDKAESNR